MSLDLSWFDYEEFKKVCLFVFKKYFKKYTYLKDDLIQEGFIKLFKYAKNYDNSKCSKFGYYCNLVYYSMLGFLNSQFKKIVKENISFMSFDDVLSDDLKIEDVLPDDAILDNFKSILDKDCLKQCIINALNNCCKYKDVSLKTSFDYQYTNKGRKKNFKQKKFDIIKCFLICKDIMIVAKKFNVSKQCVHRYKLDFANSLKEELKKNCYYD